MADRHAAANVRLHGAPSGSDAPATAAIDGRIPLGGEMAGVAAVGHPLQGSFQPGGAEQHPLDRAAINHPRPILPSSSYVLAMPAIAVTDVRDSPVARRPCR